MTRVIVGFRLKMTSFDPQAVIDHVANKGAKGLNATVLPHLLEVSRSRSPVGKPRSFNPRAKSFSPVQLAPSGSLGSALSSENVAAGALEELRGFTAPQRAGFFRKAFGTSTRDPNATRFFRGTGANKGKVPDELRLQRGTIRGAFAHQSGTLRDSHVIVPARREGMQVVGKVRATADYAMAIHEGFTHKGGQKKTGRSTRIKGRKWLKESLVNVRDDLANPSTYEG